MYGLPWFDFIVAPVYARREVGTRDRLLRLAGRLVREEGPRALTLEAVARRAHVGRGTVRYHFGGKQGLVEALVHEQREHVAELLATLRHGRRAGGRRTTRARARVRSRKVGA
ncbi:TetR/AcrR family transcriptional regulator [Pyxidicoccus sp. 3LG]